MVHILHPPFPLFLAPFSPPQKKKQCFLFFATKVQIKYNCPVDTSSTPKEESWIPVAHLLWLFQIADDGFKTLILKGSAKTNAKILSIRNSFGSTDQLSTSTIAINFFLLFFATSRLSVTRNKSSPIPMDIAVKFSQRDCAEARVGEKSHICQACVPQFHRLKFWQRFALLLRVFAWFAFITSLHLSTTQNTTFSIHWPVSNVTGSEENEEHPLLVDRTVLHLGRATSKMSDKSARFFACLLHNLPLAGKNQQGEN